MPLIGILSLQGSVIEHQKMLQQLAGVTCLLVKDQETLQKVDGLILPGGESTTIAKLLHQFGLFEPLRQRILAGMPVWGTCAGMILLAKNIVGEEPHLGLMDITVRRNAYGRQIDSFEQKAVLPAIASHPLPLVFIRAPWIEQADSQVEILCVLDHHIVAARQQNMLVTSFHPELTDDLSCHRYFQQMCADFCS